MLAPMEGLAADVLRDVLTEVGGWEWCVNEFVRVCRTVLPHRSFTRVSPGLQRDGCTRAGAPVRVQLLGCA